uniref:Nematode cuticle collagen N-terminal domain-containing protein n=1 Tax=Ditylenchus dipsaci TaxID=166011 RepID=A0A915DKG1_9BILA
MKKNDVKQQCQEADNFKRLAFLGIALSTVATLTAVIAVPMLYNYMQHIQSSLQTEIDFCQHRAQGLMREFVQLEDHLPAEQRASRLKRNSEYHQRASGVAGFNSFQSTREAARGARNYRGSYSSPPYATVPSGYSAPAAVVSSYAPAPVYAPAPAPQQQCSCGVGASGNPGPPGSDGFRGKLNIWSFPQDYHLTFIQSAEFVLFHSTNVKPCRDGDAGLDGQPGQDAPLNALPHYEDFCFDCPAGPPGLMGRSGLAGPSGLPGNQGPPGRPSRSIRQRWKPGATWIARVPRDAGPPGQPGVLIEVEGPMGSPGIPGTPGPPGFPGQSGQQGKPGQQGQQGSIGDPGIIGRNGLPGSNGGRGPDGPVGQQGGCDHCPPPRTAPGY